MKTLTKADVSLYLFEDSEVVQLQTSLVSVGDPLRFQIADCNSANSYIHEGVTPPEDWVGGKYLFDGNDWILDPAWSEPEEFVPPTEAQIAELLAAQEVQQ